MRHRIFKKNHWHATRNDAAEDALRHRCALDTLPTRKPQRVAPVTHLSHVSRRVHAAMSA
jgi:hypothetical protein